MRLAPDLTGLTGLKYHAQNNVRRPSAFSCSGFRGLFLCLSLSHLSLAAHALASNLFLMHSCFQDVQYTVKASNLGPHVNFELFFQKGLLSSKLVLYKNEQNQSRTKSIESANSILFLYGTYFTQRSYGSCKK